MHSKLISLIDTLVPQTHLAHQDGVDVCRNRQREALKAIRHSIYGADQERLKTTVTERRRRTQTFDVPNMLEAYSLGQT